MIRLLESELYKEDNIRFYTHRYVTSLIKDRPEHVNNKNIRFIFNFDNDFITEKYPWIIIKPLCEVVSVDNIKNYKLKRIINRTKNYDNSN